MHGSIDCTYGLTKSLPAGRKCLYLKGFVKVFNEEKAKTTRGRKSKKK